MESCLIGLLSKSNCHETWYCRKPGLKLLSLLSPTEVELIAFRSLICDFCLGTVNKFGSFEQMLICKDCTAKAHPSCMKYSKALAAKALEYPWQCIECKTCVVCCSASDGASILFCDGCDKAYHMKCHQPEITNKPEGKWICGTCVSDDKRVNFEHKACNGQNKFTPSPTRNERRSSLFSNRRVKQEEKHSLSMLVNWTASDVSDYFISIGFPDQAPVFTREEIDGTSLLLLKRSDVIDGLSLKLGPAVKIYEHIAKLQNANAAYSTYNFL